MAVVLVVDDKIENRKVLTDFFKFFGRNAKVEILHAASGKEAVQIALEKKPELIFMDINMETSYAGLDATKEIKSAHPEIKIWAVTAQAMQGYEGEDSKEQKCLNAGCDKFVSKPFNQKLLLADVAAVLNLEIPERFR